MAWRARVAINTPRSAERTGRDNVADDGKHIDFFVSYTGDDEPWAL